MRLSSRVAVALSRAIDLRSPSPGSELFLFGSRTDTKKKGGDIDLLLVTDSATQARLRDQRDDLRSSLREAAGDQRVDISVITPQALDSDPFFSFLKEMISLKKW